MSIDPMPSTVIELWPVIDIRPMHDSRLSVAMTQMKSAAPLQLSRVDDPDVLLSQVLL